MVQIIHAVAHREFLTNLILRTVLIGGSLHLFGNGLKVGNEGHLNLGLYCQT